VVEGLAGLTVTYELIYVIRIQKHPNMRGG